MKLEIDGNSLHHSFDYDDLFRAVGDENAGGTGEMLRTGVRLAQEGNRADARCLLLRVTEVDAQNETACGPIPG